MVELRFVQYQHNASIIAKIDYAKPKFNSNKCKLIGFIMKVYGSVRKKNPNKIKQQDCINKYTF